MFVFCIVNILITKSIVSLVFTSVLFMSSEEANENAYIHSFTYIALT